jgi:Xaa-Pro dipeptidase
VFAEDAMLTADGCRARRERLWAALPELDVPALVLADPLHLRYLANFFVDPISLGGDFGGLLVLRRDGHAAVYHDRRLPPSVNAAHVDERVRSRGTTAKRPEPARGAWPCSRPSSGPADASTMPSPIRSDRR